MPYTAPPTKTTGDSAPASDWNTYIRDNLIEVESRKEANHTSFTTSVSVTATVEASSTTIVTASAVTANGTDVYEVEFYCGDVTVPPNAGNNLCTFSIFDGATQLGRFAQVLAGTATTVQVPVYIKHRLVPTNGSHTYSVRAFRTNANCTVNAGAGGTGVAAPGFIRVIKVQ